MTTIAQWPDGDWCFEEEVFEYMLFLGKSDDYEFVVVDDEVLSDM